MEKIPSSLADAKELFPLGTLRLGTVAAAAKWSGPPGSRGPMTQGWAGTLFVVCSAPLAGAAALVLMGKSSSPRGGGSWWLMSGVMNKLGQELCPATGQFVLGFLGRSVLARSAGQWRLSVLRSLAWRGRRAVARCRIQTVARTGFVVGDTGPKHVCNRRQPVGRLLRGYMVDVRCARKIRGLVGDVPGERVRVVSAGEGLAKRSRLNDTLIGKVFVGRCHDAQSRRRLVASRHAGRLCGELVHSLVLAGIWSVTLCRLLLQTSLNDLALLLPHAQTALQLLLHGGVLCDEAGRQTGEANLHDTESVSFARKSSRLCSRAGQTTLGEIELSRSVAGRRDHWGTWFLLDDDPGGSGAGYISTETFSDVRICATKRIQNKTLVVGNLRCRRGLVLLACCSGRAAAACARHIWC